MSPASRASRVPVAVYQAVGSRGKSGSKLRRASEISLTSSGLDFAARLRVFRHALHSRVERREALLDMVRAVNATLEPAEIAAVVIDRTATWVPAPVWALVSSDMSGHQSILAERGLSPELASSVY